MLTISFKGAFSCLIISNNVSIIKFIFNIDFSTIAKVLSYSSKLLQLLLFKTSIFVLITANGVFNSCATLELNLFCDANAFSNFAIILLKEIVSSLISSFAPLILKFEFKLSSFIFFIFLFNSTIGIKALFTTK